MNNTTYNDMQRIALFTEKIEVESFFGVASDSESLFEPHYNMAPAHPILILAMSEGQPVFGRARWGLAKENEQETGHLINADSAGERLNKGSYSPCVIPVSGFYLWKKVGKRSEYPFFIRLLNASVMAIAGIAEVDSNGVFRNCAVIQTDSSALVHPLSEQMPLLIDSGDVEPWLKGESDPDLLAGKSRGLFLLTEMSVMRVSKKVNDLSENGPDLIQPLPK